MVTYQFSMTTAAAQGLLQQDIKIGGKVEGKVSAATMY